MQKKISVIMPVHNEEKYLREAIESFLSQTIASDCELICIDDGSTDSSAKILEEASREFANSIVVIQQLNLGAGQARNAGLNVAGGEFVAFLDSDDLYPSEDVLETMYTIATDKNLDIVGGSMERINGSKRFRYVPTGPYAYYDAGQGFDTDGEMNYRDYQFEYGYYRFIYKRELIDTNKIRFPNYRRYQDPQFMVQAMLAAERFYALNKLTYTYRVGIHKVTWNRDNASDVVQAITDLGEIAETNGLATLLDNCIHRLCVEFEPKFRKIAINSRDRDFVERVEIGRQSLAANGKTLGIHDDPRLRNYFTCELLDILDDTERRIKRLKNSNSWKIGRVITWLPRKSKRIVRKMKRNRH